MVSCIRLPSVTHSLDQGQRINFLPFQALAGKLTVTAPANANVCPPGHYMLFVLNKSKVPSVAKIVQIGITAAPAPLAELHDEHLTVPTPQPSMLERDATVVANAHGTHVAVGVTPTCPYGIAACWGGAYEALSRLEGVDAVRPIPNAEDSVAYLYLRDYGLPNLDAWPEQFAQTANGTYLFRGVEVTLRGIVQELAGRFVLEANDQRPLVTLAPLLAKDRIQWNHLGGSRRPLLDLEATAYKELVALSQGHADSRDVTVTGPLTKTPAGFVLQVRKFQ
jgi:galactose oxidase